MIPVTQFRSSRSQANLLGHALQQTVTFDLHKFKSLTQKFTSLVDTDITSSNVDQTTRSLLLVSQPTSHAGVHFPAR